MVRQQITIEHFDLNLATFGRWGWETLDRPDIVSGAQRADKLWQLGYGLGYDKDFLAGSPEQMFGGPFKCGTMTRSTHGTGYAKQVARASVASDWEFSVGVGRLRE